MKYFAVLLTVSVLFSLSPAQSSSAKHVTVVSNVPGGSFKPGDTFKAEVKLTIAKGWHVNSHAPAQDYMIGTALVMDSTEGYTVTGIQYPKGQSVKLAVAESPINVYDGTVAIVVIFKASADVHKGQKVLKGKLTVQACNNQVCVAPSSIPVSIPVTIGS